MLRSVLLASVVFSLVFLAGCEKKEKAKQEAAKEMVVCSKCQAVWVKEPVYGTGKFTGEVRSYTVESKEICPDCKAAAKEYFATGKMGMCKACGEGSLCVCKDKTTAN